MKILDINSILNNIKNTVDSHKLSTGDYSRWLWADPTGNTERNLGSNAYGCADAANILYTLNCFPRDAEERKLWVSALQAHQSASTGMFEEGSHLSTHTTAHCTAALELFDTMPLFPFYELEKYQDFHEMEKLLESLQWDTARGPGHIAPAIYSSFVITGAVGPDWVDSYFDWLNKNCDPEIGLWRRGTYPIDNDSNICQHMGDGFHFLFTYENSKQAYPAPDKLIDTCLDMCTKHEGYPNFGRQFHFIEVDWVFCLNRSSRQTKHRFDEVKSALYDYAECFISWLNTVDWKNDDGANDLHMLFGTLCCLTELQLALPGLIKSDIPLRMTLDRRPFI